MSQSRVRSNISIRRTEALRLYIPGLWISVRSSGSSAGEDAEQGQTASRKENDGKREEENRAECERRGRVAPFGFRTFLFREYRTQSEHPRLSTHANINVPHLAYIIIGV